jgi:hypothetical protein
MCPNDRPVLDELWVGDITNWNWDHLFEPNNGKGIENCVVLLPDSALADTTCISLFRYICQIINV